MMAGGILLPSAPQLLAEGNSSGVVGNGESVGSSEIRIALIGKGGMGTADANCALRVPGVKTRPYVMFMKRVWRMLKNSGEIIFS